MSQTYSITIFTDTRINSSNNPGSTETASRIPHGFIGFNSPGKATEYYGFAPAVGSTPVGAGAVTPQVDGQGRLHEWDFAYTIQVSEAQFYAMYNQHLALQANPPTYVFPAYDCMSGYMRDVLYAGYKAEPSSGGQLLGISTVLSVPVLGGIPQYGDLLLRTYADLGFGVGTTKASELPGYGQSGGVTLIDARTNYGIEAGKQPIPVLDSSGNIQGYRYETPTQAIPVDNGGMRYVFADGSEFTDLRSQIGTDGVTVTAGQTMQWSVPAKAGSQLQLSLDPQEGNLTFKNVGADGSEISRKDLTFSTGTPSSGTSGYAGYRLDQYENGTLKSESVTANVGGNTINATYLPDGNGGLKLASIDAINGKPPTDPDAVLAAFTQNGITPDQLASGNIGDTALADINGAINATPALLTATNLSALLNLIQAIRSGQPLPIISSSVNLVSVLNPKDIPLAGASAALGSLGSLLALQKTLENHDLFGSVNASAQLISYSAQLYAAANGQTLANALKENTFGEAGDFILGVSEIMPYLNIANAIIHGDAKSAILAALTLAAPPVGIAMSVISMFIRDDPAPPSGSGYFYTNADGSLGINVSGVSGGDIPVGNVLRQLKTGIEAIIANAGGGNPATLLALNTNRLSGLSFDNDNFSFFVYDPNAAAPFYSSKLIYDGRGNRTNAPVGSDEYFRNLGEQFILSALSREAVALPWETETAQRQLQTAQAAIGPGFASPWHVIPDKYKYAGATEVEGAAMFHQLAPAGAAPSFKPILLDMNGDGVINTLAKNAPANQVAFDVDDSGYLRRTAWAAKNASGKADGFLVLDRNHNARADTGSELFSNAQVADELKGVSSLRWVDANLDGVIDQNDPVFDHLWVWQDNNSNGLVDEGESISLASLNNQGDQNHGIALHYDSPNGTYTYDYDGTARLMSSSNLDVDPQGSVVTPVMDQDKAAVDAQGNPLGLYVAYSDGTKKLVVNALRPEADGKKSVGGLEDLLIVINNSVLGSAGITIRSAQGGVASVKDGMTVFTPDKDYNGPASFTYTYTTASGTTTQVVKIDLKPVNDAPQITGQGDPRPIYGYRASLHAGNLEFTPIYQKGGTGFNLNGDPVAQLATPVAYDTNSGRFQVTDPDDANFVFTLTGDPHHGTVNLDKTTGAWGFVPAAGWNTPDAFRVEVADRTDPKATDRRTDSKVVMLDPVPLPQPSQIKPRAPTPTPITSFTPGADGAPAQNLLGYRSQFIAGLTSADLGSDVKTREYVYSPDGLSVKILGKNGQGEVVETETLSLDAKTGNVKDVFQVGKGTITSLTAADGTQSDHWELAGSTGTDVYKTDGTHISVVTSQTTDKISGAVITTKTTTTATLTGTTTLTGNGVTTTSIALPPPLPTTAPADTAPIPPSPAQALTDAVGDFVKGNSTIGFKIAPDGSAHLSYTSSDGIAHSYDAGTDGHYVVSQTPKSGAPTYLKYDPAIPGAAAGGYLQPQSSTVAKGTAYNFAGGTTVIQNPDGTSQYQIPLASGKSISLQVDSSGSAQIKVYQNGALVSIATASYNPSASGGFTLTQQPLPTPPSSTDSGSYSPSPSEGGGYTPPPSEPAPIPGAYNGGSTSFSAAEQQNIYAFFNSGPAPTPDQIAAAAASIGLTADQVAAAIYIGTGASISGGTVTNYIDTNLGGQYVVNGNGVITGGTPIVLDLDGDGLHLVSLKNSSAHFDIAASGERLRTGWVASGDALLAYDADGNGKIDRFNEISFTGYLAGAKTDLEGLTAFDDNRDGKLTKEDAIWSKLRLWQDKNGDGVSDDGELATLDEMGIASIGLTSDHQLQVQDGNVIFGNAQFTRIDGSTGLVGDVKFDYATSSAAARILTGTGADDTLVGGDGDDTLAGGAGSDVMIGGAGNDMLDGGTGQDVMIGGTGNDTYTVDDVGDQVLELAGEGYDTVYSSVSYVLPADVEALILTGSASLTATGNDLDNKLIGNDGNSTLEGGGGNDTLIAGKGVTTMKGGLGDDTYIVSKSGDSVIENAVEGTDTVLASVDYRLSDNVENLILTGNAVHGTGNDLDNIVTGNNLGNRLEGGRGDDTLLGGTGADTLDGGAGADLMVGGAGDDTYVVDNIGDVVVERPDSGTDTVLAGISYALTDNVENLTLTSGGNIDGAGNALDNVLLGNAGNNMLDGKAGADTMAGGAGDDTYIVDNVGDKVIEKANEGTDTVYASVDYTLGDNLENLVLTGMANLNGTGNAQDNILIGNAGDNALDGGAGADTMMGGKGDDSYLVDNAGDVVIENTDEGNDTVTASIDYTLTANVESLVLTGSALRGAGNDLDNLIVGNDGNNVLDGGTGADMMMGGKGDDTYYVDNIDDIVIEKAGEGTDTIVTGIDYALWALPTNVENLILTGTADLIGTGNALDNTITGNAGNNLIDGGLGADTMAGGSGDDTYVIDNAGDIVTEQAGEGIDTVRARVTYTLADNVENLILTGKGGIDGTDPVFDHLWVWQVNPWRKEAANEYLYFCERMAA